MGAKGQATGFHSAVHPVSLDRALRNNRSRQGTSSTRTSGSVADTKSTLPPSASQTLRRNPLRALPDEPSGLSPAEATFTSSKLGVPVLPSPGMELFGPTAYTLLIHPKWTAETIETVGSRTALASA